MRFEVSIKRSVLIIAATAFALLLNAYFFLHNFFQHRGPPMALSKGDECADLTSVVPKINPNKMLFISCGGFLE